MENIIYNELRIRSFKVDVGSLSITEQEIRSFLKINDSFKKVIITSNTPKPFYTEDGILMMSVYDFLRNRESLEN